MAPADAAAATRLVRKRLTPEEKKTIERCRLSGEVYYHPLRTRFEHDGKPLKGITSILQRLYWPHYSQPSNGDGGVSNRRGNRGAKGYIRGSKVGVQVAKWGNTGRLSKSAHSFSKRTVRFCINNKIEPVRGEYPIGDVGGTMLGTGVDLLASCVIRDEESKRLVKAAHLIEIKTGSAACWRTAQGKMHGVLKSVDCMPLNMAMVQLALTFALFRRYKPRVKVGACSVLHVTADEVTPHVFQAQFMQKLGEVIYKDVKRHLSQSE